MFQVLFARMEPFVRCNGAGPRARRAGDRAGGRGGPVQITSVLRRVRLSISGRKSVTSAAESGRVESGQGSSNRRALYSARSGI